MNKPKCSKCLDTGKIIYGTETLSGTETVACDCVSKNKTGIKKPILENKIINLYN